MDIRCRNNDSSKFLLDIHYVNFQHMACSRVELLKTTKRFSTFEYITYKTNFHWHYAKLSWGDQHILHEYLWWLLTFMVTVLCIYVSFRSTCLSNVRQTLFMRPLVDTMNFGKALWMKLFHLPIYINPYFKDDFIPLSLTSTNVPLMSPSIIILMSPFIIIDDYHLLKLEIRLLTANSI